MSEDGRLLEVLHALRVRGVADPDQVAVRAGLTRPDATAVLLDAQAAGLAARVPFAGPEDWSLTERGKAHGERLLAAQLDALGLRPMVEDVVDAFGPWNHLVVDACTRWQLADLSVTRTRATLPEVLRALDRAADGLASIEGRLSPQLPRFSGYHARFTAAVERARDDPSWVAAMDRDSAHRVWFEMHEDLLATLARAR